MEVRILEKHNGRLRLFVQGLDLAIANSLRRAMIAEVPSMAIEDIVVIENSSSMVDETLALRLGLIPLKTDLESYVLRERCDCQKELGCSKCNVTLTLEAEAIDSIRTVYSEELQSSDPNIIPARERIPILKLSHNQKIRLEAYARLGQGREHAKWQPVSVCTVRPTSEISIRHKDCDVCTKCIEACPKKLLRIYNNKVEILDYENCDSCKLCVDSCPKNAIKLKENKDTFIFNIESTGALLPEQIFNYAIEILKAKALELIESVSGLSQMEKNDEKDKS